MQTSYVKYGAGKQTVFRSEAPIDADTIVRYAPSILADHPHESRGERYAFIPTADVLGALAREGFRVYEVRQTRCRDESKRDFTKHLVRMRHPDARPIDGGEVPEIILVNSHDGSSSYQLMSGIFRMICSNGLIAGDIAQDIRIRHSGNVVNDVIEGSFRVVDELKQVGEHIGEYKSIALPAPVQGAFAKAAAQLRWETEETPIEPQRLLTPRRWEDRKDDLWTTMNRVQENLMRGGVAGRSTTGRRMSTREVTGVNENVKLNRALWTLADEMARLMRSVH